MRASRGREPDYFLGGEIVKSSTKMIGWRCCHGTLLTTDFPEWGTFSEHMCMELLVAVRLAAQRARGAHAVQAYAI